MDNIKDTVDIETIIKPIFNFKAAFRILSNKGANAPFYLTKAYLLLAVQLPCS